VEIVGMDGLAPAQVELELKSGAKFVIYQYCFSVVLMSFKRSSSIHYLRPGQDAFIKGLPYSLGSVLVGWWGFPWGPIWTISTIFTNCRGGRDVTQDVIRSLNPTSSVPTVRTT
jgi:hypothetical protein